MNKNKLFAVQFKPLLVCAETPLEAWSTICRLDPYDFIIMGTEKEAVTEIENGEQARQLGIEAANTCSLDADKVKLLGNNDCLKIPDIYTNMTASELLELRARDAHASSNTTTEELLKLIEQQQKDLAALRYEFLTYKMINSN
jgi:hypothetical protein